MSEDTRVGVNNLFGLFFIIPAMILGFSFAIALILASIRLGFWLIEAGYGEDIDIDFPPEGPSPADSLNILSN